MPIFARCLPCRAGGLVPGHPVLGLLRGQQGVVLCRGRLAVLGVVQEDLRELLRGRGRGPGDERLHDGNVPRGCFVLRLRHLGPRN